MPAGSLIGVGIGVGKVIFNISQSNNGPFSFEGVGEDSLETKDEPPPPEREKESMVTTVQSAKSFELPSGLATEEYVGLRDSSIDGH
jgi:hypothetical protein